MLRTVSSVLSRQPAVFMVGADPVTVQLRGAELLIEGFDEQAEEAAVVLGGGLPDARLLLLWALREKLRLEDVRERRWARWRLHRLSENPRCMGEGIALVLAWLKHRTDRRVREIQGLLLSGMPLQMRSVQRYVLFGEAELRAELAGQAKDPELLRRLLQDQSSRVRTAAYLNEALPARQAWDEQAPEGWRLEMQAAVKDWEEMDEQIMDLFW